MSYVGNKPAQTTIPADDSVTTAMVQDDAVTADKVANAINTSIAANTSKVTNATHTGDVTGATALTIAADAVETTMIEDDAVTADKLADSINTAIAANTAKVTNATHTGDVTGATALTIANDAVDIAMLSATGTADATTFLRGDNAWAAPAGGDNTPAFQAYLSSNQSIPNDAYTLIECDTEDFDTGSGYDTSTFTYTVPSGEGGVYWIYFHCDYAASANSYGEYGALQIRVNAETNSTASFSNWWNLRSNPGRQMNPWTAGMRTLAAADTIKFYAYGAMLSSNWTVQGSARRDTLFGAYKMLGIT